MKGKPPPVLTIALLALLCGCASRGARRADLDAAFQAGHEAAFELMGQSGIPVIRLVGPFDRSVLLWREHLTLAEALLEAGYQPEKAPSQILVQRGAVVQPVSAAQLLAGEGVPVAPGVTIRVVP